MLKSVHRVIVGVGAGVMLLSSACSNSSTPTSSRPAIGELHQGLNVLDATDPSWGINAAFVGHGRVVYIETRQGSLKPDVYRRAWPTDPANEMDTRIVDQNGLTFFAERGGDNYVDPAWANEIYLSQHAPVDPVQRDLDWKLAREAAAAMSPAGGPTSAPPKAFKGFEDHLVGLRGFAKMALPTEDEHLRASSAKLMKTSIPDEAKVKAYGGYSNGDYNVIETDKFSASTGCFAWICAARHSATRMWAYRWNNGSPYWIYAINANNHGRSASELSYECYSQGGWVWNGYVSGSTANGATGNWDGAGGCQTSYNWDSGGWDHLCNDDAAYELWQAKSGSQYTSQGDYISFTWNNTGHFACACQNNGGCDGDWNTPNCP